MTKMLKLWNNCKKIVDTTYVWKPYNKLIVPPKIDMTFVKDIEKEIENDIDLYIKNKIVPSFHKTGTLNEKALYCRNSASYAYMASTKLGEVYKDPELIKFVLNEDQKISDIELCIKRYNQLYVVNKKFMRIFMLFD
jgi:hypothetical protein